MAVQVNHTAINAFRHGLMLWFEKNGRVFPWRSAEATDFERIISEILLQRTQAITVANNFSLFFATFKKWEDLSNASTDEIGRFLKPLGLWRQRAVKLKALGESMTNFGGVIPEKRAAIEQLAGVGQYVANAIELLIYKQKLPLIDVNMARVLERYFGPRKLVDIRYDPYLQALALQVVDCPDPLKINFAILDFAALICKSRKPLCEVCPIAKNCQYFQAALLESKSS